MSPLPLPGWYLSAKVGLDLVLGLAILVVAGPVILLAALLVKLTSRGPAFYSQTRLGLNGRSFRIYKLRTMAHDCERRTGPQWATRDDPRVTPLGRLLRRTHVDELPQLWNVLRGQMSLVGPRPERPEFVAHLALAVPCYRDRLLVRPGITGLAQVQLPPDTDLTSVRRKLAYDLYYVRQIGLGLDLRIILSTLCYLVGIPFSWPRRLLRVPGGPKVERAYERLAAAADRPLLQPA
jgi:lipopolysaccharide/colanic/teichoic acid biosynthesis glycosyltransferase